MSPPQLARGTTGLTHRDLTMTRHRRGVFSAASQYSLDFAVDLDIAHGMRHNPRQSAASMERINNFQSTQLSDEQSAPDLPSNVIPLESVSDRTRREIYDLGRCRIEFNDAANDIVESWRALLANSDPKVVAYAFEVLQDAAHYGNVPHWLPELLFDAYLQTPPYSH
ncbi:hypothetical protein H7J87_15430 [Mycolicibacterium wolinskyi]|uniref:hypothetical protein n=1 Tax=Mycolicibacterium TaxID=1866885 RepID=UPI001054CA17|nr:MULTISPECIES: hypothetical protein [Mycolicibacterium]MCV7286719.1 hypothetical protein [Mycolicibacterium wolinskyi]MCV7293699.1 hypothetical protein [Mycolicibacterium goodii]